MNTLSIILIAMLGFLFILIVWAIIGTIRENRAINRGEIPCKECFACTRRWMFEDSKRNLKDLAAITGKSPRKGERIMRLRQDHLAELLQDEAFREAYENLEPEFEIAEMLLEYRAAEGITQEELAKRIKINRSDLSKLESGSANPTLKTLKKIASVLRVKLKFVDDIP
jgi:DNA-binding XRE family transcriptional regulator